ncbi:MAG TPA: DegT/DnrJ/EryC1/StrS family aminotransferase [bacterium]|nr:DegT/DnrJ/EryC1/StrS family aminotransferase [bacterium]
MPDTIPLFLPRIDEASVQRVAQTLRSGWISEGRQVLAFEQALCAQFGFPRALAVNSGTSALHLALLALGVGPGDEVITTAQTFVATALAILYCGATPVFADLEPGGANLDPAEIGRRAGPRTKAVLLVHYGGEPCDMDAVLAQAKRHGLAVVEDAAHALGARYRSRPVGALGDAGIFSFQAIKPLTTGDGGLLVCADPSVHQKAYRLRWFGMDRAGRTPSELGQPEWAITELGYKYHMNDLTASLGLGQLEGFQTALARRRALDARYRGALGAVPGLALIPPTDGAEGACWLFTVLVERRLDFVRALRSRGVEAAVWHRRIDAHPLFGGLRQDLPRQERFDAAQVSIPLRDSLDDGEAGAVLDAVRRGW